MAKKQRTKGKQNTKQYKTIARGVIKLYTNCDLKNIAHEVT